jgi:hypothetical protein
VDPASLARRWWEIWRDGDLASLDDLVTDPFVRHGNRENARRSLTEVKRDMARYRDGLEIVSFTIDAVAVAGAEVWQRVSVTGVQPQTEDPLSIAWLQEFRVHDGRLAEMWMLYAMGMDWAGG